MSVEFKITLVFVVNETKQQRRSVVFLQVYEWWRHWPPLVEASRSVIEGRISQIQLNRFRTNFAGIRRLLTVLAISTERVKKYQTVYFCINCDGSKIDAELFVEVLFVIRPRKAVVC